MLNEHLKTDLELILIMKAPAGSHLRTPVPHHTPVETLLRRCSFSHPAEYQANQSSHSPSTTVQVC